MLIVDSLPPVNKVSSRRSYQLAKFFTAEGHNVHIVTCEKDALNIQGGYERELAKVSTSVTYLPFPKITKFFRNMKYENITVTVSNKADDKLTKFKMKIVNYLKACKRNLVCFYNITDSLLTKRNVKLVQEILDQNKIEIVLSSYSPSYTHKLARILKKNNKTLFWVADFRDLWSLNHNISFSYIVRRFLVKYEKYILKKVDLFTSVSTGFISSLKEIHGEKRNYHLLPNGFDVDDLYYDIQEVSSTVKKIFKNKIVIAYTGSLYEKYQNISTIFEALNINTPDNIAFIFAGHDLKNKIVSSNNSVHVFNNLSSHDCNFILLNSTYLLVVDWEGDTDGVIPAKIFDYMATNKHVILHQSIELNSELKQVLLSSGYNNILSTVGEWLNLLREVGVPNSEPNLNVDFYNRHNQVKVFLNKVKHLNV
jgi:hypothetical protein